VAVPFGLLLGSASSASAHAVLLEAEPADGAQVDTAPSKVTLRFSEEPEPRLIAVRVLDQGEAELETGDAVPIPGNGLEVTLPQLDQGVYTVTWRVVSRVDGHPTAGVFAFGVGVPATAPVVEAETAETPPPSPVEIVGRWLLFVGLGLTVGCAFVGGLAFRVAPRSSLRLAAAAWAVGVVGLVLLAMAQRQGAQVGFGELLATDIGRALLYRAAAILAAGLLLMVAIGSPRLRAPALLVAGGAAAAAMLVHVAAGHAAATGTLRWTKVAAQWIHFAAVGVWLGGLAALLAGVRGAPDETKAMAIRRFSATAGVALALVAITGVVRAVQEVGSWGDLFTSGYGLLVVTKAGLLLVLAGLGAINRYRNVPRTAHSLGGLRRVSRVELGVAAGILVAAAILATLVPPKAAPAAAAGPAGVVAVGSDFAGSLRARLEVDPGSPGSNRFSLRATESDTGQPVEAERVALRFSLPGATDVPGSTLDLQPEEDEGTYSGSGSNLAVGGVWEITAVIQQGGDAVEIPLRAATLCSAQRIEATDPDQPPVSIVEVPGVGSVEGYLIELGGGRYEVHFTFFGTDGRPIRVEGEPSMMAWQPDSDPASLRPEILSRGHYLALARLSPGKWRFDGSASGAEGLSLSGCFEETIPG
jgi:copper transport protein